MTDRQPGESKRGEPDDYIAEIERRLESETELEPESVESTDNGTIYTYGPSDSPIRPRITGDLGPSPTRYPLLFARESDVRVSTCVNDLKKFTSVSDAGQMGACYGYDTDLYAFAKDMFEPGPDLDWDAYADEWYVLVASDDPDDRGELLDEIRSELQHASITAFIPTPNQSSDEWVEDFQWLAELRQRFVDITVVRGPSDDSAPHGERSERQEGNLDE